MLTAEELKKRFGKHEGALEGPNLNEPSHGYLRSAFTDMAMSLDELLPDGRNKSLAMTALEECSMWSHKAVANDS